MLKRLLLSLLLCLPVPCLAQTMTLPVDTKASQLKWTGHAGVGSYAPSGTLAVQEGALTIRNGQFAGAKLDVDMKSLNQENAQLTHHLKSSDFFDVDKYPTAVIQIDKVERGVATGSLTIKGKTTPFETPVKVTESDKQFVVDGKVTLDRTKYGINYNSASIFSGLKDKAIRDTFEVEFTIAVTGKLPAQYRN